MFDIAFFVVGCTAMLCLVVASIVILHPRIHEGLVIKLGLITLAMGSFAVLNHVDALRGSPDRPLVVAMASCSVGMLLVIGGAIWRVLQCPQTLGAIKRVSGWAELDALGEEQPPAADKDG